MHWHGNPNRDSGKAATRNAALRFTLGNGVAVRAVETAEFLPPATLSAAD
jgi:hypothetical protein